MVQLMDLFNAGCRLASSVQDHVLLVPLPCVVREQRVQLWSHQFYFFPIAEQTMKWTWYRNLSSAKTSSHHGNFIDHLL